MSHRIELTFPDAGDGEPTSLDVVFETATWATLQRFTDNVDRLVAASSVHEGLHVNVTFSYDAGAPLQSATTTPHSDAVAAILHLARPLVLEREPASTVRVCGILHRHLPHPGLQAYIEHQRAQFLGRAFQDDVRVTVGPWNPETQALEHETVINSEDIFQRWLNAYEYHQDDDKRAELEAFDSVMPSETLRGICVLLLCDKIAAALRIAQLIRRLGVTGEMRLSTRPTGPSAAT